MGINFHVKDYQCKAGWSYIGFNQFRKRIAQSLGLILETDSEGRWIQQDWEKWDKDWLIFLTHNDCSGQFTHSQCGKISKKLKAVLDKWDPTNIQHSYDIKHGLLLVDAMQYCNKNKKNMRLS